MRSDWCSAKELEYLGACGKNVKISREAIVFGMENIRVGDNVRIDAGCILQAADGFMDIGSHVHIATGSIFQAGGGIVIKDHAQIASGCRFVSASDELDGTKLVGPCAPKEMRHVWKGKIEIGRLCIVGVNSVVLPAVRMETGAVLGANSLAKAHQLLLEFKVYYGSPAQKKKDRNRDVLHLSAEFEREYASKT